MGRRHLIAAIAVVLAVAVGGAIWAGAAAGPGGRQEAALGSNTGSPTSPGAGDAGAAAASDDATSTTPAGPPDAAAPSDAATPTDPAAGGSGPDATAPSDGAAALPAPDSLPARSASSCDGLKTALADYQVAGQKSGPAGFEMLLMGLDELSGSAEIMASTDDMYQPVVEAISQVRRQWSTSYTAYEDGSAEAAAKEAQNGVDTLKAADDGLPCR